MSSKFVRVFIGSFASLKTESARHSIILRVMSAILAAGALTTSYYGFQEVSLFGFPDSHITDYQKAAAPVLQALYAVLIPLGLYFLAATISSALRIKSGRWFTIAALSIVLINLVVNSGVPWYFGTHLGLDNGFGG